ncbi:MAG: winged helix-turn-helix transcriptional regulator [Chloroflexi bacterium]|nr:winged helix-turn-helix transcriptional regulator [Chloroflexota bacterium]
MDEHEVIRDEESFVRAAFVAHALSHPVRLAILNMLDEDGLYVTDLARTLGRLQANISQHLMVLRDAGLVVAEREGMNVRYKLAHPRVKEFLARLESLAQDLGLREDEWPVRPWRRGWKRRRRRGHR